MQREVSILIKAKIHWFTALVGPIVGQIHTLNSAINYPITEYLTNFLGVAI